MAGLLQLSLDTSALEAFTTSAAARADALDAALREGLGELRAGAEVASADAQKVRACASLRRLRALHAREGAVPVCMTDHDGILRRLAGLARALLGVSLEAELARVRLLADADARASASLPTPRLASRPPLPLASVWGKAF